ncbi:MAG: hypothetical protein Q9228_003723 [Teloschistes exilis]
MSSRPGDQGQKKGLEHIFRSIHSIRSLRISQRTAYGREYQGSKSTKAAKKHSIFNIVYLSESLRLSEVADCSSTTTGGFDISYGNIYTTTQSHDHPVKESTVLKTRVSDLEVINILNKSQVGEQDQKATQSKQQLRQVLEKAQQEKYELKGAGGVDQPIVVLLMGVDGP